jgi:hypothetical protein
MSLPPPAAPQHRDDEGRLLCNASADDDRPAALQWPYEIATEDDAARLGEMIGVPLIIGDTVPVFGCQAHIPPELAPPPEEGGA